MGQKLAKKIEEWKKRLLDTGRRNRLINFRETKRSTVKIIGPSINEIFEKIAIKEEKILFPYAKDVYIDNFGVEHYELIKKGDVEVDLSVEELQKSLNCIRYKARTSIEEQGVNTLFLAIGFLRWQEREDSSLFNLSPLILVPVRLMQKSMIDPFELVLHEDEIVINPTLVHKLSNDYGIVLPEFNDEKQKDVEAYLSGIEELVEKKEWEVKYDIYLTCLSFLKINMYKDLENNLERLNSNDVISVLSRETLSENIPIELNNYDFDKKERSIDVFQVVDADSSQLDAILLSKKGISFVLQGPPGTGKSQTITNIIAEAIAAGKKVLFVSEKMAALQVVYNRLESVELSDFCLNLHNYKANKKEILNELYESTQLKKERLKNDYLLRLKYLDDKKDDLNKYQEELHKVCSELRTTVFNVNGELAKLKDVPDLLFAISDVDKVNQDSLTRRRLILGDLANTINSKTVDYANNVWKNAIVTKLTHELWQKIDYHVSNLLPLVLKLKDLYEDICKNLKLSSIPSSLRGIELLVALLDKSKSSPLFPKEWILGKKIDSLFDKAEKYKQKANLMDKIEKELKRYYDNPYLEGNVSNWKSDFLRIQDDIGKKLKNNNEIFDTAEDILYDIKNLSEKFEQIRNAANSVANVLHLSIPENLKELREIISLSKLLSPLSDISLTISWFDNKSFKQLKEALSSYKTSHGSYLELRSGLLEYCDEDIFKLDFYPILQRFRSEYTSWFRFLNSDYRKDMRTLQGYMPNRAKFSYENALDLLNNIKIVTDIYSKIKSSEGECEKYYGDYYESIETKWDTIEHAINEFESLAPFIFKISSEIKDLILNKKISYQILKEFEDICGKYSIDDIYSDLNSYFSCSMDEQTSLDEISESCKDIIGLLSEFIGLYKKIRELRIQDSDISYKTVMSDLDKAIEYQSIKKDFDSNIKYLKKDYGEGYDFTEENSWDTLLVVLSYAQDFNELVVENNLSKDFIQKVSSEKESVDYCKDKLSDLIKIDEKIKPWIEWFIELFDSNERTWFYKCSFDDLEKRLSDCKDGKHLLVEWIDFCRNRQRCIDGGLSDFVSKFEEERLDAEYMVQIYLKRFYSLWLDKVEIDYFSMIQDFRGGKHKGVIDEFRQLDKQQFQIARNRIREKVISAMPDYDSFTEPYGELGTLKRELGKKRKQMPVRRLFSAIPNLITDLRPCFMMSPLSVSMFLEARNYEFDLVIFDEASQVHTEDAVGAIMRGKQVIIVGDRNQLPPTNFFVASLENDDFDMDNEDANNYDEIGAYESILDEAVSVFPERSLRWHYRSRNENLIAFSNAKIYNNLLITFPSAETGPDTGVEYVYVADGIYDRGGKKNNVKEARKVVDLIFTHFRNHPDRSLGVITFSEPQQTAVETLLRQERIKDKSFEQFFVEDKDEPFFIKNLENVQGDERDTIIFSIGYAKDSNGIMHMNFGPLSHDGGQRRLNVAITRAKYNVKLVGSIQPSDIDLNKVNAEGVRLLRSYIEFAQIGVKALTEIKIPEGAPVFDSPFEEAVYDFLQSKNYNVVTQVGCSGFRIDMAVKHPTVSDKFVLGIECDGASYHSARTVRERDRLRQEVLESMGWTIYRIWSTDWIKDTKAEEDKLVKAIEGAMSSLPQKSSPNPEPNPKPNPEPDLEPEPEPAPELDDKPKFVEYQIADISKFTSGQKIQAIREVIETEQPIHIELLCNRIAKLYGKSNASKQFQSEVLNVIKNNLKDVVCNKVFITVRGFEVQNVRKNDDNNIRSIEHISGDELMLAIKIIVSRSIGIECDELITATREALGYKRTGQKIEEVLKRIYKRMLDLKILKEIDGIVTLVEK